MTSNFPLQSAIPTCKHHVNEQLSYYCQTCKLRVCEECCHGRHMTHKWMSNKKFAIWIRQNSKTRCEELEDMIRGLDNEDVKMEVDIGRIEDETWMKKMLQFFQKDINEADDKETVEMEEEFNKKKQNLASLFGDVVEDIALSKVKVTEESNFTYIDNSDFIYCIFILSNSEALIKRFKDEYIDHVDITGKVLKRLPISVDYFIQLNKDIVFNDFNKKKICRVTPSGTKNDIYSTAPLHPTGICISHDGGLLVTMCSCNVSEITSESYGEVHHIDTSGGIIHKYSYTGDRKSRLFIHPRRVAQNKNTDLCVVEYKNKMYRSRLMVVSLSSQIKFIYTGQPTFKKMFMCNDIVSDHHGRMLLVDALNHAVHLLIKDGQFLRYVPTIQNQLQRPQSLGLYGDTLWVGCANGDVRVYTYKDEE